MSTLKVDSITNAGNPVNFPKNAKVINGFISREYYSQATPPENVNSGAIWWDTSTSTTKIYLNAEWYTFNTV